MRTTRSLAGAGILFDDRAELLKLSAILHVRWCQLCNKRKPLTDAEQAELAFLNMAIENLKQVAV